MPVFGLLTEYSTVNELSAFLLMLQRLKLRRALVLLKLLRSRQRRKQRLSLRRR